MKLGYPIWPGFLPIYSDITLWGCGGSSSGSSSGSPSENGSKGEHYRILCFKIKKIKKFVISLIIENVCWVRTYQKMFFKYISELK